jgi:multidrug efflux pump subunit AcrA (membrane-fusion protein)
MKIVIGTFFLGLVILLSCNNAPETVGMTEKPLTEAVYASGFIRGSSEIRIYPQTEGILAERKVREGDTVEAGQVLFVLEHKPAKAKKEAADNLLRISKENISSSSPALREAETMLQSIQSRLQFDSLQYQRYSYLVTQEAVARVEAEKYKLQYNNTRNEYSSQLSRVQQLRNRLEQEWMQARSGETLAEFDESTYKIVSPVAGRVLKILKEPGELLRRGEEIALLSNDEGFIVKLSIDEQDISKINTGQLAYVKLDAEPGQVRKAQIQKIYPLVNTREQSVQVDAILLDAPEKLLSGMAVEANIIIQQKDKTYTLPRSAVKQDSVWVLQEGKKERRAVKTGMVSLEEIEIISGLSPDEKVILAGE